MVFACFVLCFLGSLYYYISKHKLTSNCIAKFSTDGAISPALS